MNIQKHLIYFKITVMFIIAGTCILGCSQKKITHGSKPILEDKPNVIIILADDAGYSDFGFMGSKDILTPNLDSLAKDGVVFTDAHVTASVCSPSRAGLLTGRYQQRFGHECNLEPDQLEAFDSEQITIAEFLQTKNYNTSIFGKWHLGEAPHQHPLKNGFDYFWGFLAGGRSYFPNEEQYKKDDPHMILENYNEQNFKGYLTDVIGDKAVSYIKQKKDEENPFFMYLSFNAPHTPMHAKEDVLNMFGTEHQRPVYAAMMWSMDQSVGKVIAELKTQGIYENTLIFFLSDNGGAHNNGSSVKPLKGWKGNQYEGGTRVPFVATWIEKFSPRTFSGLTSSMDIYQTVASLWNERELIEKQLDGSDLLPYLTTEKEGNPHDILFWRKDEMATARADNYKYIVLKDSFSVMYDLNNDLIEENNIISIYPEKAKEMEVSLLKWQNELINPLWKESDAWNKVTRYIYSDLMNNMPPRAKSPEHLKSKEKIAKVD